ncbi:MAG: carboxypeptidase-like regulatory domain-containing protein, partial [Flavobacterium sp.]|nr:carboxypeptidase-like regulatory domain-containing protein [Flavobacterium sp.]
KEKEIGNTNSAISQAFDNGPRIDVKYFPYYPDYKKTKYIKQVIINTDSKIESAICKIHFYSVAENGFPGAPLLDKDFIVTIKQGLKKTRIDITQFNLRMPKNGLFIGFEKLIIERNKLEKTTTDYNNNTTRVQKIYFPLVLYNFIERNALFTFSGGKWNKETAAANKKIMVYEPAINLILTN